MENIATVKNTFRVLGLGKEMQAEIEAINQLGIAGLEATICQNEGDYEPKEGETFVILVADEPSDLALAMAKKLADEELFAVLFLSQDFSADAICACTVSIVPREKMTASVEALLRPLIMPCQINIDFNDLKITLKDCTYFKIMDSEGTGEDRVKEAVAVIKEQYDLFEDMKTPEAFMFMLYSNNKSEKPLMQSELGSLVEMVKGFSTDLNILWGAYNDPSLEADKIRITGLVSGH